MHDEDVHTGGIKLSFLTMRWYTNEIYNKVNKRIVKLVKFTTIPKIGSKLNHNRAGLSEGSFFIFQGELS